MKHDTENEMTIGIDLGDQYSHFCALDSTGEILEEGRMKTTKAAFEQRFKATSPMRIAIEASTHSPWISILLKEAGHEVIVANPRKLRMIFQSDSKNDRFDASQLARVARLDPKLLYPVEHRRHQARVDQGIIKSRDSMVCARTRLVNHVRSIIKSFGGRLVGCLPGTFGKRAARQIPRELRPALIPILRMIEHHNASIRKFDRLIESMGREQYPETTTLRQVNGVGAITALSFVLTLDDPTRFKSSRSVGAFLGLRPKQDQSGERNPELRITKAGNRDLRRLLIQCAQYILGPFGKDSDLRRFGEAIAARGGKVAKRRALVAVARKRRCCRNLFA
jgi:transposase